MVMTGRVVPWWDYTKTHWDGVTHLSAPYARETLCGLNKVNKPTTWEASNGDGCEECARTYLASVVTVAVRNVEGFTGVSG
jgi:hypothetical protein